MKKLNFAIILTAVVILTMSFTSAKEWYILEDASYRIEFPEKPTNQQQSVPSAVGELKMDINMYDASAVKDEDNMVYGMITTEYPDSVMNSDKKELLPDFWRNSTDGAVKNVKGKLLSEKKLTLGEFPGYEIRIDFQDGMAVIVMRSFLVHNKMYVMQTIAEPKKDGNKSSKRFFESFKLKG